MMRTIGRLAAVGAVALVLAGSAAAPAAAMPRRDPSVAINQCVKHGGEAYYFEFAGVWAVGCRFVTADAGTTRLD
jgi:hypothetical protein